MNVQASNAARIGFVQGISAMLGAIGLVLLVPFGIIAVALPLVLLLRLLLEVAGLVLR